eukprot:scaffold49192_cov57-Phaeocystis_antarctica.AAC.1
MPTRRAVPRVCPTLTSAGSPTSESHWPSSTTSALRASAEAIRTSLTPADLAATMLRVRRASGRLLPSRLRRAAEDAAKATPRLSKKRNCIPQSVTVSPLLACLSFEGCYQSRIAGESLGRRTTHPWAWIGLTLCGERGLHGTQACYRTCMCRLSPRPWQRGRPAPPARAAA